MLHSNGAMPNYNQHIQCKAWVDSDSRKFTQCRLHDQEALNQARRARRARDQGDGGPGPLPQDCRWALAHIEPGDTKKTGTNSRVVGALAKCVSVELVELATKETEAQGHIFRTVVGR